MTKLKGTIKNKLFRTSKKKFITAMARPFSQADEKLSTQQKTAGADFFF